MSPSKNELFFALMKAQRTKRGNVIQSEKIVYIGDEEENHQLCCLSFFKHLHGINHLEFCQFILEKEDNMRVFENVCQRRVVFL